MNALEKMYKVLPGEVQTNFKIELCIACKWNGSQFYSKMNGKTRIRGLEAEKIISVAKKFSDSNQEARENFPILETELSTLV